MANYKIKLALGNATIAQRLQMGAKLMSGWTASTVAGNTAQVQAIQAATMALGTKQAALDTAMNSIPGLTIARDQAKAGFDAEIAASADYIQAKMPTDGGTAATAIGFELASTSHAVIKMPQVLGLQLSPGDHPGAVDAHWTPVVGRNSYVVQFFVGMTQPAVDAMWNYAMPATASKTELQNLPSMQRVWVRVAAVGAGKDNLGAWSDPIYLSVP